MKIGILTIGDELMSGNIDDTNASWLSDRCCLLGHRVMLRMSVADTCEDIQVALKMFSDKVDTLIVTGGLGRTVDDITIAAASKILGTENRSLMENKVGSAPGVKILYNDTTYFFLPGVPKEMKQIFTDSISPELAKSAGPEKYFEKYLRCFGEKEAVLDELIRGIEHPDVRLSFRIAFPEIKIKLVGPRLSVEATAKKIKEKIGEFVFSEDNESLEMVIGKILRERKLKLATAESCTGGLVANMITNVSGSSEYFERGFVTYSNESKAQLLGVSTELIKKHGAVSEEVAKAMAEGAVAHSSADVAVSVTGIAGPTGGTPEKPVGTVHIAVAGSDGTTHKKYLFSRDREWFKEMASAAALDMIRRYFCR